MPRTYYHADGTPRVAAEKSRAELLSTCWTRWRRDARCGRPCFVSFSPAAISRLDEACPSWRTYADFLGRRVIRAWDHHSTRLDRLHRLFLAGRAPIDDLPEDAAAPELAAVA